MSERYQKEIEEILRQAGGSPPPEKARKADGHSIIARVSRMGRAIGDRVYLNPGRLMFTGLALLLSAVLVSAVIPGLIGPIVWVGLILFVLAYVLFFARPAPNPEKRWRGRLIDTHASRWTGESLWDRFQRRLRR